jgi:xylulokinase
MCKISVGYHAMIAAQAAGQGSIIHDRYLMTGSARPTGVVLGFDFGTSALKAAMYDVDGTLLARTAIGYTPLITDDGLAEQDPEAWWHAMAEATRSILDARPVHRDAIVGLGVSAQMCGTIPVDANGTPLHRCLLWLDTRSAAIARRITAGGPRIAGYGVFPLLRWLIRTNGAPSLAGFDPLTKMLWFREARPAIWRRTARLLDVKDWLLYRLCGRFVTTPDLAQLTWLMDNRKGRWCWSKALLDRMQLAESMLPEIVQASDNIGTLCAQAADHLGLNTTTIVSGGVGDVNAVALAAGRRVPEARHLHVGTSLWMASYREARAVDPFSGIATLCSALPDRYLLVATQQNAGAAVNWAARALGFGSGQDALRAFDADANTATPGPRTPLFLPWLAGERVPVDDRAVRAGFVALNTGCDRADLAYAVLLGVALNARWALSKMARLNSATDAPMTVLGGGADSAIWCQTFADVLQVPVRVGPHPRFAGARGAAMTAAVAAGWHDNLDSVPTPSQPAHEYLPNTHLRSLVDERYDALVSYYTSTRRWQHRFLAPPFPGGSI